MKLFCLTDNSEEALLWFKKGLDMGFAEVVEGVIARNQTPPQPAMPRTVKKAGAKVTRFTDFIINSDETEWIIGILNNHIDKDKPKQAALCVMGGIEAFPLAVGFVAAFISGCVACKWMINIVKKGKLIYFGIYCAIVGVVTILCSLLG